MHLADTCIQSDLQYHLGYTFFLSVCVFPGNWNHKLCAANAMLYHWGIRKEKWLSFLTLLENTKDLNLCEDESWAMGAHMQMIWLLKIQNVKLLSYQCLWFHWEFSSRAVWGPTEFDHSNTSLKPKWISRYSLSFNEPELLSLPSCCWKACSII